MEVLTEEAREWLLAIRTTRRNALRQPARHPEYWMDIFVQGSFRCEFHDITQHADRSTHYEKSDLSDVKAVEERFERDHASEGGDSVGAAARVQIAKIERSSPENVLTVLQASGIDLAAALLLLKSPWFHFQHSQENDAPGLRTTFYLSRDDTRMAWVYNHASHITRGVLLQGSSQSPQMAINFQRFRKDVFHPLALVFFNQYRVVQEFEESCHWVKSELSDLEDATGHKFFPTLRVDDEKAPRSNLAESSRKTSALNLQILRIRSWVKDAEALCAEIRELAAHMDLRAERAKGIGPSRWEWESSVHWHAKRLEALREHATFLKARIDIQNHVVGLRPSDLTKGSNVRMQIFNLISQEDARQGILLSRSSTELAEAAKADSSSMQTIAVMTMVFLPGTFFAALFAMPLFQWDQSNVLQERFWVYLAFTIPSTILVFVVWTFVRYPWSLLFWDSGTEERRVSRRPVEPEEKTVLP